MSILPMDAKSQAARCSYRNVFPVLPDETAWWPSRAMTKGDYRRIEHHVRLHERSGSDHLFLSLVSCGLLGLDEDGDDTSDGRCVMIETEVVRERLSGFVDLAILDSVGVL